MPHYFISGTDTEVGKTFVTCLLLKHFRAEQGEGSCFGFKPICCGERTDAELLRQAAGNEDIDIDAVNPVWLRAPAAPLAASMIENRQVNLTLIEDECRGFAQRFANVLVEGAGGWETPILRDYTMADLAKTLGFPVIVVVNNRLGALNHTILTVRSIEARGLKCAGVILNHVDEERDSASITNRALLEDILEVPVLADVMHDEDEIQLEGLG